MDSVEPKADAAPETDGTFAFTDKAGREWSLSLDYGLIDQIKADLGHNLEAALEDEAAMTRMLFKDRSTGLVPILFAICEDQANARNVSPEDWPRIFDRGTIERATEALIGAISTFLYGSRIGGAIREQTLKLATQREETIVAHIRTVSLDADGRAVLPGSSPGGAASRASRRSPSANSKT